MSRRLKHPTAVLLALLLCSPFFWGQSRMAFATESAFGRYLPGVFAGPASEIVPPKPGFYWQSSTFFYSASGGKDTQMPFGGTLRSELEVDFFNFAVSGFWVPDWNPAENVNVGIGVTVPLQSIHAKAKVGRATISDDSTEVGDLVITPTIGWHQGHHLVAANVSVYMPTGPYKAGELANVGLNCWTFSPNLAYTYVNPEAHIDFSIVGGIDFNTENPDTDYRSGALAHVDATLLGTLDNGLGAGIFGSMLYQISDDQGELADRLNGFRGRSFAVGPMVKYSFPGEHQVTIDLNWAPEFGVKNRLEGDAVYLNIMGRF